MENEKKRLSKGAKLGIGCLGILILFGIIAAFSSGSEISSTQQASNSTTESTTPAPANKEPEEVFAFSDGKHEVGKDIQPGTYRTKGGGSSFGCYWARLKGFSGELGDIIANNGSYDKGSQVITISATDKGFETRGCGKWYAELMQVTSSKTSFGDGMFIVGTDIEPGTYKSSGSGTDYSCYWARLKGFSGELGDIVANEISGNTRVTIATSDKGFSSTGCGTWQKQ